MNRESVVRVSAVSGRDDLTEFIRLPWRIYRGQRCWVPPLISEQKAVFNRRTHPFFEHSQAEFFLARRNGVVVGRIAAIRNNNHLGVHQDGAGFFGFFECEEDAAAATALFDAAGAWCRDRGLTSLRGPANYSVNDDWGLLVDAFDRPPSIMMPYNPPYYETLLREAGFLKAMDLFAYHIDRDAEIVERLARPAERFRKSEGLVVRPIRLRDLDREAAVLRDLYNQAWMENWGAVPVTVREMDQFKDGVRQIAIPELVLIAEVHGEPVGFSVTIPDINEVLIHANGRLKPWTMLSLLCDWQRFKSVRVILMGVLEKYRRKGVDIIFYHDTFRNAVARGVEQAEISWVAESNTALRHIVEDIAGIRRSKTYRLFEKPL